MDRKTVIVRMAFTDAVNQKHTTEQTWECESPGEFRAALVDAFDMPPFGGLSDFDKEVIPEEEMTAYLGNLRSLGLDDEQIESERKRIEEDRPKFVGAYQHGRFVFERDADPNGDCAETLLHEVSMSGGRLRVFERRKTL